MENIVRSDEEKKRKRVSKRQLKLLKFDFLLFRNRYADKRQILLSV